MTPSYIEQFIAANWLTIISVLIGLAASYITYRLSKRTKEPRYAMRSTNLVANHVSKISDLAISYQGKPISNLTVSKVALWNAGRDPIREGDIPKLDPLTITAKDNAEIRKAEILYSSREANELEIDLASSKKLYLRFKYLDRDQGAVVQLWHTGLSHDVLDFTGSVIGATIKNATIPEGDTARGDIFMGLMGFVGAMSLINSLVGQSPDAFLWVCGPSLAGISQWTIWVGLGKWAKRVPKDFMWF
jgi:hypothetical protein